MSLPKPISGPALLLGTALFGQPQGGDRYSCEQHQGKPGRGECSGIGDDKMIENGEPAATVAASSTAAPSCYRVSLLSGSLEISARLKSADDLDLLVRVLEANKALFTKAEKLEPQILANADRPATMLPTTQSGKQALVRADRSKAKTKTNGSAREFLTDVDQSEQEILTLT